MTQQKTAVAYIRTSTEDQLLSVEAQRQTMTDYCKRNNIDVLSFIKDIGTSGGAPLDERESLLLAVDEVGRTEADFLLVAKRDRLARDVVVSAIVERMVEKNGATIVSCDGVSSEDTPEGKLMRTMIDAFAQYERQLIKARTKAALHQKRIKGEKLGGKVPFGYQKQGAKLEEHENEQGIISFIKTWKRTGHTYDEVVEKLKTKDIKMRGKPFTRSTVVRICKRGKNNDVK